MWNREFEQYASRWTVVRYDVRGLGQSPPATGPYSDSEDLYRLLDHLGLEAATVVGCSNGGRIALDFALGYPASVRAIGLVACGVSGFDGSTDPDGRGTFERDGARCGEIFAAWKAGRHEEALEALRVYWCSSQGGTNLELVRTMMRENAEEIFTDRSAHFSEPLAPPAIGRLDSIGAPIRILYGDHDEPTIGYIVRRIALDALDARLTIVPGADHLLNLSAPHALDAMVDELRGGVLPSSGTSGSATGHPPV